MHSVEVLETKLQETELVSPSKFLMIFQSVHIGIIYFETSFHFRRGSSLKYCCKDVVAA